MALLETGANVQSNGYLPGYYPTRNLIFDSEGSTWISSNVNRDLKNDCHIGSLPASTPYIPLGYDKEILKQTILKHEAIFREQIHELHRVYQRQRELMDEIKRNELNKHNFRLEASGSSSYLSSKNAQKIFCSPDLPCSTGQSPVVLAEGFRFSLASLQEKSKQICCAPADAITVTEGSSKNSKPSQPKYRRVGKKILDLQLPAEEYIDHEEGETLETETVTKVPQVSAYSVNGISRVVYNNEEQPYGTNTNGFADLNVPFKLEEEAAAKVKDLGGPRHYKNKPFHDLSRTIKLRYHMPGDVIHNLNERQDLEACSDGPLPNQKKKHEQLYSGQSGGVLDSFAKVIDTEKQSASVESLGMNLEQVNDPSCFRSLHQIQEPWSERKSSSGEGFAATHGLTSNGLLGPSSASHTCALYQLVSAADIRSSGISPAELWKKPVSDFCQSEVKVQALPYLGTSASLGQSSKPLMGMFGFTQNDLYQGRSVKPGPNLDNQIFLPSSSFCSMSKLLDLPSIGTNDPNSCDNHSSSANHVLGKYLKGSEDVGTSKNINLNVMPAVHSDTTFQCIQITDEENKFQDSRRGLPWLTEKSVPQGKPNEESKNQRTEEMDKGCGISDVSSPCNNLPALGEQITSDEHLMKDEQKKCKPLAGIIDLNSCMNEDGDVPTMDVDFQAPASPENKECSPPRGESDENQLEMPYQLIGPGDLEVQEEQAKIAAEALVSISGSVAHNGLRMTACSSPEYFVNNPLNWFAGIASTIRDVVKMDFSGNADDIDKFLPTDMDYFEFMTLNLTETNVLDYCCKSSVQTEQEGGSNSPTQMRKGRANRGRWRKDFQSDILPSLASLSRYEVTEDLQTIGGLVEAAGSHSEIVSLRNSGRNALGNSGRNALARGRRRSSTLASNMTDLLLKQLSSNNELGTEKRGVLSWGKICRKKRGQRYPISNPKFVVSQIYH